MENQLHTDKQLWYAQERHIQNKSLELVLSPSLQAKCPILLAITSTCAFEVKALELLISKIPARFPLASKCYISTYRAPKSA